MLLFKVTCHSCDRMSHFKGNNLVAFGTFTVLCDHHL